MTDLLDILDQKGNKTGQTKSFDCCHKFGYWHKTVHIWIVNDKKEILLQKRSMKVSRHPGKWHMSVSGHLGADEDSESAAIRETYEEIGLKIDKSDLIFLFSTKLQTVSQDNCYMNNEFNDVFLIKKNFHHAEFNLDSIEVSEIKWVSILEFEELVNEKDEDLLIYSEEYERVLKYLKSRL